MGAVYQAYDRLTGTLVALKRVNVPLNNLAFNSRSDYEETALALTQEFRLLSALRHPNIITVLDYGFAQMPAQAAQPYFTMQLLEEARPITAYVRRSFDEKIELLLQTLQALRYLHRFNVLHRDLKPANILVANDQVKVLDFGLAIDHPTESGPVGTLAYMSPEALRSEKVSIASDLYAFGLIMYELLTGEFPYVGGSMHTLLTAILTQMPELDAPELPEGLKLVIKRLLDKQPENRYPNANAVIVAICEALARPLPRETVAIRESFLQSAKFIGREHEVQQLMIAFEDAKNEDEGSAWLIGGESGVGKSRLLQEIRVQTMVKGALVLLGQAIPEGNPYHLWQPIIRQLVIRTPLNDAEAAILRLILPDIDQLLGRDIPPIEPLSGKQDQQRLHNTVIALLERQTRPLVLLLEDIHWGAIDLLQQVFGVVPRNAMLVIATYRDDEAPDLPDRLSGAKTIKLARLSPEEIAALTVTMVGDVALRQPQLIQRIQTETEGNVFFLVEVMRVLAEEAGSLEQIGRKSLPERIFAGGIERIVERRLDSIPAHARPLLRLAAVLGRDIELPILNTLLAQHPNYSPNISLEEWVSVGVAAAIFSAEGERVRFAHDKLREYLLVRLEDAATYHRHVARAIEDTYPDVSAYADRLLHHWQHVGDEDKIVEYAIMVGEQRHQRGEYSLAGDAFQIAYDMLRAQQRPFSPYLIKRLANGLRYQGRYEDALHIIKDFLSTHTAPKEIFEVLIELQYLYSENGYLQEADNTEARIAEIVAQIGDDKMYFLALKARVRNAIRKNTLKHALTLIDEAMEWAHKLNDQDSLFDFKFDRSQVLFQLGDVEGAKASIAEVLPFAERSNNVVRLLSCYVELGIYAGRSGNYAESLGYYKKAFDIAQRFGNITTMLSLLVNLGVSTKNTGNYDQAIDYYRQALELAERFNLKYAYPYIYNNRALAENLQGRYANAVNSLKAAFRSANELGFSQLIGHTYTTMADIALSVGDYEAAAEFLAMAYTKHTEEGQSLIEAEKLLPRLLAHIDASEFEAIKARIAPLSVEARSERLLQYELPATS